MLVHTEVHVRSVFGGRPPLLYLPDALLGRRYYEPSDQGLEARIEERLEALRAARRAAAGRRGK